MAVQKGEEREWVRGLSVGCLLGFFFFEKEGGGGSRRIGLPTSVAGAGGEGNFFFEPY